MRDELNTFLTGISAFLLSNALISGYRYYTTFQKLCETSQGLETGLMVCPSYLEVFAINLISPLSFLLSALIGTATAYFIYKQQKN